jgi:acetyltransferase-like isoleucine patch superfamily enzyme
MNMLMYLERRARNLRSKAYTSLVRRRFRRLDSHLDPSVEIKNPEYISVGRGVALGSFTWIYAITDGGAEKGSFTPSIEIGDGCSIGRFCHITCSNKVVLEDHVFVTEGALITDSIHGYEDITTPIICQPLVSLGPLVIGNGSWIGNGARIVGRVRIGRNCVVGANSVVVNKDIPDYCVVAGVPARIVKRYDFRQERWVIANEPLESISSDRVRVREQQDRRSVEISTVALYEIE